MQLWTDYEGVIIDGAYPLQELLMPEGRSAFYTTSGPDGERRLVRLIECHFDEEEILARWRSVEALNHPNFLKFEHFGQTEIDERPVVYAVLEKVDANLAEVLQRGTLSSEDVAQLGLSLVAALDVLHTHGFIHEHVEPRNIFALNDTVKLRSDCIREAPEGEEGRAAKRRDVHDLANVLLQGLTQRDSVEGLSDSVMPKPFSQIIRKGLDGTWGLEDIRTALEEHSASTRPAAPEFANNARVTTAVIEQKAPIAAAKTSVPPEWQPTRANLRKESRSPNESFSLGPRWFGIFGFVAVLVIVFLWAITHRGNATRIEATHAAAPSPIATQTSQQISTGSAPAPSAGAMPAHSRSASAGHGAGWRVIAFTYNRRTDAEKKVSSLASGHPELEPAVFTSSGHSPYLVSIGGVMDQDAAYALAHRSSSLGLPHDMYAQNYSR